MPLPSIPTEQYFYDLPSEKIAQYPLEQRDSSKLLVLEKDQCSTKTFTDLPSLLPKECLILFNNTKVIPARILYQKSTGGIIELFCLEPYLHTPYEALQHKKKSTWLCMVGGAKKWPNDFLLEWTLPNTEGVKVMAQKKEAIQNTFLIDFFWEDAQITFGEVLEQLGQIPIPPYLQRKVSALDGETYQTVFASQQGSVAAPTAGLHFTPQVMQQLLEKKHKVYFSTLHVGAGTFKPVTTSFAHEHAMHSEWVEVDTELIYTLAAPNPVVVVGTTSLRTVESVYWYAVYHQHKNLSDETFVLPQFFPYTNASAESKSALLFALADKLKEQGKSKLVFKTALMIMPGYTMKIATHLITNFHQPNSTLLMLVDAFTKGRWKMIYSFALENDYRFLSYGDACLLHYIS